MLARSFDEVPDVDGLWDLYAAVARCALRDYQTGPSAIGHRHYETAVQFLETSGLITRIPSPPAHATGPRQLHLFDERRGT